MEQERTSSELHNKFKSSVDVLLGSGNDFFLPKVLGGKREDNQNLVDSIKSHRYEFISNPKQLIGKVQIGNSS